MNGIQYRKIAREFTLLRKTFSLATVEPQNSWRIQVSAVVHSDWLRLRANSQPCIASDWLRRGNGSYLSKGKQAHAQLIITSSSARPKQWSSKRPPTNRPSQGLDPRRKMGNDLSTCNCLAGHESLVNQWELLGYKSRLATPFLDC